MLRIGLTGGIASGKSTVAKMLADLGAPVFDADKEAHLLLAKDGAAYEKIKNKFATELGYDILDVSSNIDRKKLGAIVFSDKNLLQFLEQVMHEKIREKSEQFVAHCKEQNAPAAVLDIPLLIENIDKGWREKVDCIWLVYVPAEMQKKRLAERDSLSLLEIEQRLAAQMPIEEKKVFADVLLDNSGTLSDTAAMLKKTWDKNILSGGKDGRECFWKK